MDWISAFRLKIPSAAALGQSAVIGPVILASAIALYAVGDRLRELVSIVQASSSLKAAQKPAGAIVERKLLSAEELGRYRETLMRLHPSVAIEMSNDSKGFSISISDPKLYSEWMFALYSLQSYGKSVLWDVSKLCLKGCGGQGATAVVEGYTQSVKIK